MKSRKGALRALLTGAVMSAAMSVPALAAPTFDEVMAAPDDLALNLEFARAEANAGELLSAAGALERVLLFHPNAHQARLLYAAVLHRLGDYQAARRQMALLDNAELTPLQRAEKDRYVRSIERRESTFELTGQLAAGLVYEEDALGALLIGFDAFGPPEEEEGTSQVYSGRVDATYKLRPDGALDIYGSVSGYHKSDISGPETEFERGEVRAGLSHTGRKSALSGGAVARAYRIEGETHLTEAGVQAAASRRLSTATTVFVNGEAVEQSFDNEPVFGGGRDGSRVDVNLGLSHRFSARSALTVGLGHEWKDADREPLAYDAPHLDAVYDLLLGRGAYLALAGSLREVKYREADPFLFGETRKDSRRYGRAALGAPLSAFSEAGATGDIREDIKLEAGLSYIERRSSSPIADYESFGAEVRLIWRFGR